MRPMPGGRGVLSHKQGTGEVQWWTEDTLHPFSHVTLHVNNKSGAFVIRSFYGSFLTHSAGESSGVVWGGDLKSALQFDLVEEVSPCRMVCSA